MNELEISALVTKGYLAGEARNNPKAIKAAVEALISDLAFELEGLFTQKSETSR